MFGSCFFLVPPSKASAIVFLYRASCWVRSTIRLWMLFGVTALHGDKNPLRKGTLGSPVTCTCRVYPTVGVGCRSMCILNGQ